MTNFFHTNFLESIKAKLEDMEGTIREKIHKLSNEQIQDEVEGWVHFSKTLDTKFFRITETNQLIKALISQVMEERNP